MILFLSYGRRSCVRHCPQAHRQELDHLLAQFDSASLGPQPVRWAERAAHRGAAPQAQPPRAASPPPPPVTAALHRESSSPQWHGHSSEDPYPRRYAPRATSASGAGPSGRGVAAGPQAVGGVYGVSSRAKAHFGAENLKPVLVQAALEARGDDSQQSTACSSPPPRAALLAILTARCVAAAAPQVEKGRGADSEAEFAAFMEDFQRATERLRARVAATAGGP